MKVINCQKIIPILTVILLSLSFSKAFALDIVTRETLSMDETLSDQGNIVYSQPKKIYVSEVKSFNPSLTNDTSKWIKLLYYYSITRLNLEDIPYNYLVDEAGNIYEGRSGGLGANPSLENGEGVVVIGYLSSKGMLTPRASDSLKNIVQDISYKYGINKGSFDSVSLNIVQKEGSISYMQAKSVSNSFSDSVSQALSTVEGSEESHLEYKASIASVDYNKEVGIGDTLDVTVKVKNENDFTWFSDSDYIYVSTKDSTNSPYFVNSVWDSETKPAHLDKAYVKPGDTVEITFKMLAKSKPGTYTAEFNIVKSPNILFENSELKIDFTITSGGKKLVQIVSPEYGFVNIRDCRWYSCKKVEVANDGDVFVTTGEEEGWYKIEYQKDSIGWVYQKYIKVL